MTAPLRLMCSPAIGENAILQMAALREENEILRDALQTLLDSVEGNRVTVGDTIQANRALRGERL